jgi:hypothetical protein
MNLLIAVPHNPHRSLREDIIGGEANLASGLKQVAQRISCSSSDPPSRQQGVLIMTSTSLTRRTAFVGAATLAFVPAVAVATTRQTIIGKLWADAEDLNIKISAYRNEIAAAAHNGGISGWMRLGGEANTLGGLRYARLMAILNAKPETPADLAIMARVVLDDEIHNGAKSYAADQFAKATVGLLSNVA